MSSHQFLEILKRRGRGAMGRKVGLSYLNLSICCVRAALYTMLMDQLFNPEQIGLLIIALWCFICAGLYMKKINQTDGQPDQGLEVSNRKRNSIIGLREFGGIYFHEHPAKCK